MEYGNKTTNYNSSLLHCYVKTNYTAAAAGQSVTQHTRQNATMDQGLPPFLRSSSSSAVKKDVPSPAYFNEPTPSRLHMTQP